MRYELEDATYSEWEKIQKLCAEGWEPYAVTTEDEEEYGTDKFGIRFVEKVNHIRVYHFRRMR